jgi:hypothetical protein
MTKNQNQIKSFHTMANYSFLFSTFINLYYNPKNDKIFFKKIIWIFIVCVLFLCYLFLSIL